MGSKAIWFIYLCFQKAFRNNKATLKTSKIISCQGSKNTFAHGLITHLKLGLNEDMHTEVFKDF